MTRAGVLGHPIEHSLSPVLHRAAYAALGLDWEYDRHDVTEDELGAFLAECGPEWAGLSLTMPLKQTALGLCDHVEPLAEVVGAVNTVLLQRSGRVRTVVGANTDVHGIVAALREAGYCTPEGRAARAVVLGAGATAASTLAALGELGITDPLVLVRSLARTGSLRRAAHRMGVEPTFGRLEDAPRALVGADVVVSTVPGAGADAVADGLVTRGENVGGVLLDVVYDPRPTALQAAWRRLGGVDAPGERMLLHQAAEQVRLMTGHVPPLVAMSDALEAELARRGSTDAIT
ncbi:shikimate dehydrogenase [Flavimobilis sp. GY10621]|uniref:Shikimate dehydrogenase n=1 Tax=Flavimobilis rhizosphaerae TaxID=2775421 RepID=A0ABR9DTA6_9MICO|nr:shikimate dehydrogenase [Flavimobilis rhizosphaerae]MBD9700370.1 shikimate dehydrogenase [Flavimobilis rhizosphaerae]